MHQSEVSKKILVVPHQVYNDENTFQITLHNSGDHFGLIL